MIESPDLEAIRKFLAKIMDGAPMQSYLTRYSIIICEAGHHLTGEGPAPTECPFCKAER